MQPSTREIGDGRPPAIGWSAVLAGSVVALGLWGVLQLLGVGVGLTAIDPDDAESVRAIGLGSGAWSVLAPMIATFAGGYLAVRLASTYDPRVATYHGLVVWGVTAATGLVITIWLVTRIAPGVPGPGELAQDGAGSQRALQAAEDAGKGLLAFALAILMAGGTALLGAFRAVGDRPTRPVTAPYPLVTGRERSRGLVT